MSPVLIRVIDQNFRASVAVELGTITLLVDAGIVTIEQAAQRLEAIPGKLPATFQTDDIKERIAFLVQWLRENDKPQHAGWSPVVIPGGLGQTSDADPTPPEKQE